MSAAPLAAQQSPIEIARASGSNFLLAFAFLSPGRRRGLLAVYAFCRVVDDAVDLCAEDGDRDKANRHLEFWEHELDAAFDGSPSTPLGYALHRAAGRFAIDKDALADVCRGVRMDLEPRRYETFDDLALYMSRVASAVGIACLPIFGADPARSRPYAEKLGLALQYANILRDIAEDGDLGRCYLPMASLQAHAVDPAWLCSSPPPEVLAPGSTLASMLTEEHTRCRELFQIAHAALPSEDRRALRPARIMGSIYSDLRRRVERLGPGVLTAERVRVPLWRKSYLALFGI